MVTALGAFNPIKFVPLFVPSFNLISPPVEALLPTDNVSIALFESVSIADLAVSWPWVWSNKAVKYLPPIISIDNASPLPSTPPVPRYNLSPPFAWLPVPYV